MTDKNIMISCRRIFISTITSTKLPPLPHCSIINVNAKSWSIPHPHFMHRPNQQIIDKPHTAHILIVSCCYSSGMSRCVYTTVTASSEWVCATADNSVNELYANNYRHVTPKMACLEYLIPKRKKISQRSHTKKGHYPLAFISMLKERSLGCRFTVNNLCAVWWWCHGARLSLLFSLSLFLFLYLSLHPSHLLCCENERKSKSERETIAHSLTHSLSAKGHYKREERKKGRRKKEDGDRGKGKGERERIEGRGKKDVTETLPPYPHPEIRHRSARSLNVDATHCLTLHSYTMDSQQWGTLNHVLSNSDSLADEIITLPPFFLSFSFSLKKEKNQEGPAASSDHITCHSCCRGRGQSRIILR